MRHRYQARPSIQGTGATAYVVHGAGCTCGWTAPAVYRSAELAEAAWLRHTQEEGTAMTDTSALSPSQSPEQ